MSSKRKRTNDYIIEAHARFLDEHAKTYNNKIATTKFIKPGNIHQKQFVKSIKNNKLTVGSGCSGVGKTLLALFTGVQLINNPDSPINKLVYIRAAIDIEEEKDILGILPGGLSEKLSPLTYPLYDNASLFMDKEAIDMLIENNTFEIMPLAMMRGRSFINTFVILDESQNVSPKQMKTVLTRLGTESKMVLIGDSDQCDIKSMDNGLRDFIWRLYRGLEHYKKHNIEPPVSTGIVEFTKDDILRDELTKFVLDLYET